jgi:putative peptide zinc metalloprotease protein
MRRVALLVGSVFRKIVDLALTKVGLAIVSFAGWTAVFSWQFACVVMGYIAVHESGHVWAMKKMGIPTKGFFFIPFLGGAAVPKEKIRDPNSFFFVAIMGPAWGGAVTLAAALLWAITGNLVWAGIGAWSGFINLANLVPIVPFDGGAILFSLVSKKESRQDRYLWLASVSTVSVTCALAGFHGLAWLAILVCVEVLVLSRGGLEEMPAQGRPKKLVLYLLLTIGFYVTWIALKQVEGAREAFEAFQ